MGMSMGSGMASGSTTARTGGGSGMASGMALAQATPSDPTNYLLAEDGSIIRNEDGQGIIVE